MMKGGICRYRVRSQLAAAEVFLRAHRHHVSLVTIDIGANDPNSCFLGAPISKIAGCMSSRVRLTVSDLRTILSGLRAAGGRKVKIIGMNYYVPELAGWLGGMGSKEIAVLMERLVHGHSSDFTDRVHLAQIGTMPRNVATICRLTWACARAPQGPNEHANNIGYSIIALAFLLADKK
jgi:hypothetical protein